MKTQGKFIPEKKIFFRKQTKSLYKELFVVSNYRHDLINRRVRGSKKR